MMQVENLNKPAATNPWLSEDVFSTACAALPLVSIDLMLTRPGAAGLELLLGLRNNRPAQNWWFTPGGRIRKNEPTSAAMQRIARDEVGLDPENLTRARLLGAWDHFYEDSAFDAQISTHYVNLAYELNLTADEAVGLALPAGPGEQHQSWMWLPLLQVAGDPRVHAYVKATVSAMVNP